MNQRCSFRYRLYRAACHLLCLLLVLNLFGGSTALAFNGKKYFKTGLRYEATKEWDRAAEEFSLALREDPGNAEYELHYLRCVSNASLMFMDRARMLVAQGDYESAYMAYKQAFTYDPTNEQAQAKMKEMLTKQGITSLPNGDPDPYQKVSDKNKQVMDYVAPAAPKIADSIVITERSIEDIILQLASFINFNVVFDAQAKQPVMQKSKLSLKNITYAEALEIVLDANNLAFYPVGRRTILVGPKNNPQLAARYDTSLLKTFYIRNAKLQDVQTLITQMLGAGKQVAQNTQNNTLTVRDSPENLDIIQKLIASIDKPQAEVVMDVNIYEVAQDDLLQIGNQFNTGTGRNQASLGNLGGIAQSGLRNTSATGIFGPLGTALVLPPSTLSFLQSRGNTRLLAQTQLHSFESEEATVNVGQRVPIQTASIPSFNNNNNTNNNNNNNNFNNSLFGGVNQVQYNDVGLNISIKPKVIDDLVQMTLSVESSGVVASTSESLTPTFTQRKVKSVARVRDGQTTIAASVMRQDDSNSRRGIPVLSLIPGIGNLFSTPVKSKNATYILIAVTPHILRGGAVSEEDEKMTFGPLDFQIGPNGAQGYGRKLSLLELVEQADVKDQKEAEKGRQQAPSNQQNQSPYAPAKGTNQSKADFQGVKQGDGIVRPQTVPVGQTTIQNSNIQTYTPTVLPNNETSIPQTNPTPNDGNPPSKDNPAQPSAPVQLTPVIAPSIRPSVGSIVSLAVIVSSANVKISSAGFYIHYNSAVVKPISIRDGGLFNGPFDQRDDGSSLYAKTSLSPNLGAIPAAGQLIVVDFQVIGAGPADIGFDMIEIFGADQQQVPVINNPIPTITAIGPRQSGQQ